MDIAREVVTTVPARFYAQQNQSNAWRHYLHHHSLKAVHYPGWVRAGIAPSFKATL